MTEDLIPELLCLCTTMILIHNNQVIVLEDERRFDTEGAYNLRYEIMKSVLIKL